MSDLSRLADRFRQWAQEEYNKIKNLSWRQKLEYAWDYYKIQIICVLSFIVLSAYLIPRLATANRENWLYAAFANTYADIGSGSDFWKNYADYANYDLNQKNLIFNAQVYCDPAGEDYGNQYYRLLIASMDSGVLDILIMEPERLRYLGASGRLLDLESERTQNILRKYQDRIIWCEPMESKNYNKSRVAIGINLDNSILTTGENRAYADGAALGINALSQRPEEAEIFLRYLFQDISQDIAQAGQDFDQDLNQDLVQDLNFTQSGEG